MNAFGEIFCQKLIDIESVRNLSDLQRKVTSNE